MQIAFVGLGNMGQAMATHLLKSGHPLRVWNRSPGPVHALVEKGAQAADDLRHVLGQVALRRAP
jgi:3-hydroxyisobutyrate dehydrogenase-like beta-hydroxyacid dehydrogenase